MIYIRRWVRKAAKTILRNAPLQIALFFLPLVWAGYFAITASERTEALQQARAHGNSVAELFEENTERIFERVDQSLRVVRALYANDPAAFSLKFWAEKAQMASGDVVQFALIGPDGYLIETTAGYSGPPLQFASGNLVDSVMLALADSGLAETRLELEITESVFLADSQENLKTLERLKRLGVSIALDDFGVGYSSLSYLTAFPFDKVKIDKCFIDRIGRPETLAVLGSIVQLARTLNLSIVAEGVETYEQVEKIRSLGIALGQGYFFSKPVPSGELLLEALSASERQAVA